MEKLEQKRISLAKESWIQNIMRIQGFSREKTEELYEKIQPFKNKEK